MCSVGCEPATGPSSEQRQLRVGTCRKTFVDIINLKRNMKRRGALKCCTCSIPMSRNASLLVNTVSKAKGTESERISKVAFCKLVFKVVRPSYYWVATIMDLVPRKNLLARSPALAAKRSEQKAREPHPLGMAFLPTESAKHSFSSAEGKRELR